MKTGYIVTSAGCGWDFIVDVYDNEDAAILFLEEMDCPSYKIHERVVQSEFVHE